MDWQRDEGFVTLLELFDRSDQIARERQITAENELGRERAESAHLRAESAHLRAELERRNIEFESERTVHAQLQSALEAEQGETARLRAIESRLGAELAQLRIEQRRLLASTSWRVTEPLRFARTQAGRVVNVIWKR